MIITNAARKEAITRMIDDAQVAANKALDRGQYKAFSRHSDKAARLLAELEAI